MILRALVLSLALAASLHATAVDEQPTPAAEGTVAPPAAATPPAADPDEKVCKVERELGSNKLKRVCRTRAQIENDREAAREALSREQRR